MERIVRFHELGGPDVLRFEEAPTPRPAAGEVRLRVHAIGVNRCEAQFREGRYVETPVLPARIGYEAAGVVEEVGPSVEGVHVGDRVATLPAFSMSTHGVYGETAVVPANALAPWPGGLRAAEAASIWMAFLTGWGGLVGDGGIRAGDTVLLTAASSGVGVASIQIAKREGAAVIATTRNPRKREALRKAGADHVIVTSEEGLAERVHAITGGRGANLVFDPVTGHDVETLTGACADSGRVVFYGYFGGIEAPLPLIPMFRQALHLRAFSILRLVADRPRLDAGVAYVLDGLRSGALRPVVDRTFALTELAAAHTYLESNDQVGKVVLRAGEG
jgi:NADPH2:quinone reductase